MVKFKNRDIKRVIFISFLGGDIYKKKSPIGDDKGFAP